MSAALVVFATLAGLLVLALVVPIEVAFRFEGVEAPGGRIAIRWLFGVVRFHIRVPSPAAPRSQRGPATPSAKVPAKAARRSGRPDVLAVLRQGAFRRRVVRLIRDLVGAAHVRQLRLQVRLGLGDPADTGRLWGFLGPLSTAVGTLRAVHVRIEPEFMDPVFEFQAHGRMTLIPLQFLVLVIGFALSPASIRAWRTLRARHA